MEHLISRLKDRRFWGSLIAVAVMALIAIVYFYPDAVEGNVLRQHDMQQGAAIGQEAVAFHEATGETTRWTNSLFSGMPTFQISPSYPSNSLFGWISTVMGLGLPSPANILAMMMIGFFILMLSMKMRLPVALIGAVGYAFSTYFIILIGAGHIWKFVTLAYIPPTIAGVVLCYRGRYLAGGALAALFAMMQIASNHVQMSYYFLFVILGFAIAYLVTAVREKKTAQWFIATGVLAVAGVLAVTANLPSLYNTYEYSKETIRGGHSDLTPVSGPAHNAGGLDREYITQYSYTPSETFTLMIPNVKGGATMKPEKGSNKYMSLYSLPETQELVKSGNLPSDAAYYLQYVPQYFGAPEGTNGPVYVGALIVALFILGCVIVRGPLKWALLILTIFSILLSWGRYFMGLTDFMIDYMPMYAKFRTVESILVIAEFCMPVLAMLALNQLAKAGREAWSRYGRAFCWSFGSVAVLCLLGIFAPSIYGAVAPEHEMQGAMAQLYAFAPLRSAIEQLRLGMVSADSLRSFIVVAAGAVIVWLFMKGKLKAMAMFALVAVVVVADLFPVNKRYLDHDSFVRKPLVGESRFPMTEIDRAILADTAINYRVMNIPQFWDAAPSYYHKMIGGYHAAKLTRYQDLIDRHLSHFVDGQGVDSVDIEVLNMLNARYLITDSAAYPNPDAMGNAWLVDKVNYVDGADSEMNGLSTVNLRREAVADRKFSDILGEGVTKQPGDTVYETTYAPNQLRYHINTANGGVAVFSEVYFPWGWTATIDGQPAEIGRVNYLLRAVRVPAGKHEVVMRFDPRSLHTTGTAATIAIILIYIAALSAFAVWAFGVRDRRKKEEIKNAAV